MPTGFTQQQQPVRNAGFSKTVVTPQHGQAADKSVLAAKQPRAFQPRPAPRARWVLSESTKR